MNIQGWFPLRLTGLISFLSKGLSRVFPSNTVVKRPFSSAQSSLWSNSILTALYYKPGPVGGGWDTVRILIINWVREERSVSNCSLMQGEYGLGVLVVPHRERAPDSYLGWGEILGEKDFCILTTSHVVSVLISGRHLGYDKFKIVLLTWPSDLPTRSFLSYRMATPSAHLLRL